MALRNTYTILWPPYMRRFIGRRRLSYLTDTQLKSQKCWARMPNWLDHSAISRQRCIGFVSFRILFSNITNRSVDGSKDQLLNEDTLFKKLVVEVGFLHHIKRQRREWGFCERARGLLKNHSIARVFTKLLPQRLWQIYVDNCLGKSPW